MGLTGYEARAEEAIISHFVLVCVAYTQLQLFKLLVAKSRPSVCTIKHELSALVMIAGKRGR